MDDLQIAWRPLGALIPYARNPRTHSDAQVAQTTHPLPLPGRPPLTGTVDATRVYLLVLAADFTL